MIEAMEDVRTPLRIRAHNLLCLQGFEGLGYSPEFVEEMRRVSEQLKADLDTPIEIILGPDILCDHCPHMNHGRCLVDEPVDTIVYADSPDKATLMDKRVLMWLGFHQNEIRAWGEILYIVGQNVDSTSMDALCGDCRWRAFPMCANALDELKRKVTSGELVYPAT